MKAKDYAAVGVHLKDRMHAINNLEALRTALMIRVCQTRYFEDGYGTSFDMGDPEYETIVSLMRAAFMRSLAISEKALRDLGVEVPLYEPLTGSGATQSFLVD